MKYEKPEVEIVEFIFNDVICNSNPNISGGDSSGGDDNVVESPEDW